MFAANFLCVEKVAVKNELNVGKAEKLFLRIK